MHHSSFSGSSFSDSLSQSRSHYQPGYLMVTTPQSSQRVDDIPVVQTKAKLNNVLTRGSASEFGMESMFQSTQRQTFTDEDAPPRSSILDIPAEGLKSSFPSRRHTRAAPAAQPSQPTYIVVFGYPAEKYSVTVDYFKSLGSSTEAEPNTEIFNCFRIGYHDPADAMRAIRKNGDVIAGTWMVGVKWADLAPAEVLNSSSGAMAIDEPTQSPFASNTPTVGTPIRLAPSTSAFRKAGPPSKPATPLPAKPTGDQVTTTTTPTNRGMLGQVSDLIFGW